jgi:hypothetical protein
MDYPNSYYLIQVPVCALDELVVVFVAAVVVAVEALMEDQDAEQLVEETVDFGVAAAVNTEPGIEIVEVEFVVFDPWDKEQE